MVDKIVLILSAFTIIVAIFVLIALMSKTILTDVIMKVSSFAQETPITTFGYKNPSSKYLFVKRLIDIFVAIFAIVIVSPSFIIIAIAIKIESKGPAIYKFPRVGINGKSFYSYKFRTLQIKIELTEENHLKGFYDPRVTRIGRYLRKTALDELPNLINVLIGNVSLVGTTIAREFEYNNLPSEYSQALKKLKPGLTSLWLVSMDRRHFSYEKRILYDLYYAQNYSLKLDIAILFWTVILTFGETASY